MKLDESTDYSYKRIGIGIKGDYYHTSYGARISTQCFKYMDKIARYKAREEFNKNTKLSIKANLRLRSPQEVEEALDRLFRSSIDKMQQCAENYPTLKENISRWLRTIKKLDIHCLGNLVSTLWKRGSYNNKTKRLEMPYDSFAAWITNPGLRSMDSSQTLFIHEVLHAARINKHQDHNSPTQNSGKIECKEDTDESETSDMVYYMSKLCNGEQLKLYDLPPPSSRTGYVSLDQLMALKINKCGIQQGCLKYHRAEKNPRKFCNEMHKMGECKLSLERPQMSPLQLNASKKLKKGVIEFMKICQRPLSASILPEETKRYKADKGQISKLSISKVFCQS